MRTVTEIIRGENDLVWIGASDMKREKSWTWSDGTPFKYSNWDNGEPNNSGGNQDCGGPWHGGWKWDDQNCSSKKKFICKRP